MRLGLIIKNILNLPKTIYFNYKFLHISDAWRLPILVHRKVRITRKSRRKIEIVLQSGKIVYLGFPVLNTAGNEETIISIEGILRIQGPAFIAQGAHIDIRKNAVLDIGSKFNSTGKMSIICFKEIQFKDGCTVSWDTLFMDTDSHTIFELNTHRILNKNNKIVIGKHCWIGAKSVI
ncbi:LbetaH domain-containing protein [Enterococcus faecium]|nr:transferase [Enterococcus faecium]HBL3469037.1 transferase [Enterococcus faecium]